MKHITKITFLFIYIVSNILGGAVYASDDTKPTESRLEFSMPSLSEEKSFNDDFSGYFDDYYITETEAREALNGSPSEKFTPVDNCITVARSDKAIWKMYLSDKERAKKSAAFLYNPSDNDSIIKKYDNPAYDAHKDASLRMLSNNGYPVLAYPEALDENGGKADINNFKKLSFDMMIDGPIAVRLFLDEKLAGGIEIRVPNTNNKIIIKDMKTDKVLKEQSISAGWSKAVKCSVEVSGNNLKCDVVYNNNPVLTMDETVPALSERIRECSVPFAFYGEKWESKADAKIPGWIDNVEYTYKKSMVSGYDPDNAVYINNSGSAKDGAVKLMETAPVRIVYLPEYKSKTMTIGLSSDGENYTEFNAVFDDDGRWINTESAEKYNYIKFPSDTNLKDILILSEVSDDMTVRAPVGGRISVYPVVGGRYKNTDMKIETDNPDIAVYDNYGIEVKKLNADAAISFYTEAEENNRINVRVRGIDELEYAEASGQSENFIKEKELIINALNKAVSDKSTDELEKVLCGSGDGTLEKMPCIDRSEIMNLKNGDDTAFNAYLNRLMTYPEFKIGTLKDIEDMRETLYAELETGKLCNKTDSSEIIGTLENGNEYFKLPLENKYYTADKTGTADRLKNKQFKNLDDLKNSFSEAYVINAYLSADTSSGIGVIIKDCADEIGYDKTHYNEVESKAKTSFENGLKSNRGSLLSLEALKNYIDKFTPPKSDNSGGSNNRGGGGGGGSRTSVSMPTVIQKPDESLTPGTLVKPEQLYKDVPLEYWAYEPIRFLTAKRAADGYDGEFNPERDVTRAEFTKMLLLAFDCEIKEPASDGKKDENKSENKSDEKSEQESVFGDAKVSDWFYKYLLTAKEEGILLGDENGNANPESVITREQMAAMVYRMIQKNQIEYAENVKPSEFKDGGEIDDWAFSAVAKLQLFGIISGEENGRFAPKKSATRAETAKILYSACTAQRKTVQQNADNKQEAANEN